MPPSQRKVTTAPAQATTVQFSQPGRPHHRRQDHDHGLDSASTPPSSISSSEKSSTRSRRHGTKSTSTFTTTATHRSASSTTSTTALTQPTSMSDTNHEAADYFQPMHEPNVDVASYWQTCPYSSCSDPSCLTHASLAAQQGYYLTGVGGRFIDTGDTHLGYAEVLVEEEVEGAWYGDGTGP